MGFSLELSKTSFYQNITYNSEKQTIQDLNKYLIKHMWYTVLLLFHSCAELKIVLLVDLLYVADNDANSDGDEADELNESLGSGTLHTQMLIILLSF